jgi:hypothetical protein
MRNLEATRVSEEEMLKRTVDLQLRREQEREIRRGEEEEKMENSKKLQNDRCEKERKIEMDETKKMGDGEKSYGERLKFVETLRKKEVELMRIAEEVCLLMYSLKSIRYFYVLCYKFLSYGGFCVREI